MKKSLLIVAIFAILADFVPAEASREPCAEGQPCEASPGVTGICLGGICIAEIPADERRNLSFTIVVKYPEDKLSGSDLYIRGNGFGLNWQSGDLLTKSGPDTWSKTFIYKTRIDGFLCESCADETILLLNQKFEYRILVDDTVDMIGANFALDLPISKTALPETPQFEVYPWFNSTTGTALSFSISSVHLNSVRTIGVYLPPSFYENPYKKYGAILVYDLTPTFIGILQRDIFDKYIADSAIMEETILVGWGDFNQTERVDLLTPVTGTGYKCINGTYENQCDGCVPEGLDYWDYLQVMKDRCGYPFVEGGLGEQGLDFFIKEALPKAVEAAEGRLLTNREKLGIFGFSLGGLISCHAAWTRPDIFGFAACQSSSFYWPVNTEAKPDFYFLNFTLRDPELSTNRPPQRIYIDENGPDPTPAKEAADRMSSTGFFSMDDNLWFQFYPTYPHSNLHWVIRVWSPLSILTAPKGTSTRISSLAKFH